MHVLSLEIVNIRSLRRFALDLRDEAAAAGWHVLLGDNGSGKTTFVRALALAFLGRMNAGAARQDWSQWIAAGAERGEIKATIRAHDADRWDQWTGKGRVAGQDRHIVARIRMDTQAHASPANGAPAEIVFDGDYGDRTVWGGGPGWFSASFGAFRRFAGGAHEVDRLYLSHPRLAPHLSAFGENAALGESLRWLMELQIDKLENGASGTSGDVLDAVLSFINSSGLLPHGSAIDSVTSKRITVADGFGSCVPIEEMSDGYRSILSLMLELLRLMFAAYGADIVLNAIDTDAGVIRLPGVVAIDEADAHLHPAWQSRIGDWFVERFPCLQFFVTTHSPIICRAARRGSIWILPAPGSEEAPRRVVGAELDRLIDGNILDSYGTELFGEDIARSPQSKNKLERLARLNRRRLQAPLTSSEQAELERLRATMGSSPNRTAAPERH